MDSANTTRERTQKNAGLWIGPLDPGLEWSKHQIGRVMPVLTITDFDEIETNWPPLQPTHVFVSTTVRDSRVFRTYQLVLDHFPKASKFVMLGQDWQSFRRWQPTVASSLLSESNPNGHRGENTFEPQVNPESLIHWYDINRLLIQIENSITSNTIEELESFPPKLRPIIERAKTGAILSPTSNSYATRRMGLTAVITQGGNRRQLWQDLFESNQIPCITSENAGSVQDGRFSSVLIDGPSLKLEKLRDWPTAVTENIQKINRRFKRCRKVIVDSFPIAAEWSLWTDNGFACLPSPTTNSAILYWLTNDYPKCKTRRARAYKIVNA